MKRYKLLKDTPTIKAGTIFEEVVSDFDELKELVRITPIGTKTVPQWTIKDIDDFDEWFEEIKETAWKPKTGEKYWFISDLGITIRTVWIDRPVDDTRYSLGNCYRTKTKAEYAKKVQIARTKIKRSSNFVPDWNNGGQTKWYVAYDYGNNCLFACQNYRTNNGAIAYYETEEDTERAIEDLEPEYLLHFGVKQ